MKQGSGKVYLYNAISDQYEQVGLTVTGITDGDEATEYVDQLLNAENSYYSFPALKDSRGVPDRELRISTCLLIFPTKSTAFYAPSAMMSVVSKDDDWLTYNDQSYYAATYGLYEDSNSYHPGDTVHCQCVIVMPKDLTEYELEFEPLRPGLLLCSYPVKTKLKPHVCPAWGFFQLVISSP